MYGYGRHWTSLDPESRLTARKWFYGANIVYKIVLMFNKISVVCLYYRIFAVSTKYFRSVCHAMNAWIVASSMAFIIATVFQCTPIAAFWNRSIPNVKCFKNEPWWISYATVQITTDFMLLAMPIRQILRLSMSKAEKLGICLVFGTGALYAKGAICSAQANLRQRYLRFDIPSNHHRRVRQRSRSNMGSHPRHDLVRHRSQCRYCVCLPSHAAWSFRACVWAYVWFPT